LAADGRIGVEHCAVIYTPLGSVACTIAEDTTADGCGLVYVLNETMSRVRVGEEVEAVVEVGASICVL